MASRRIKLTTNNKYTQPIKLGFKNKMVVTPSTSYNSILTKVSHTSIKPSDFKVKAWLRFNTDTFDGVQMVASLSKGKRNLSIGSCTFKIYSISTDNNWTETLLVTLAGTSLPDGRFTANTPESSLSPADLTGEITYKLEVDIIRGTKTYNEIYYFSHIGIYGSFISLKQDIEFLDLTKLDE